MIDTIKGYLNLVDNRILLQSITDKLTNPRQSISPDSQIHFLKGYYKNFIFRIRYWETDIGEEIVHTIGFQGSIPKYLYGNNLASCTPMDIKSMIQSFSDKFGIDFRYAVITRIDFGFNFLVKHPISYYINSLKSYARLKKRLYEGESVTFLSRSGSISVKFYDKLKEMKERDKSGLKLIPNFLINSKILRYEVSLNKRIKAKLGCDSLTFSDVSSYTLHKSLARLLIDTLSNVVIDNLEIPSKSFVLGRGWLKDFLASIGLKTYGYDQVVNLIESQSYPVSNPSVKKSQQKKILRALVSSADEMLQTSIKNELESKLGALYGIFLIN